MSSAQRSTPQGTERIALAGASYAQRTALERVRFATFLLVSDERRSDPDEDPNDTVVIGQLASTYVGPGELGGDTIVVICERCAKIGQVPRSGVQWPLSESKTISAFCSACLKALGK